MLNGIMIVHRRGPQVHLKIHSFLFFTDSFTLSNRYEVIRPFIFVILLLTSLTVRTKAPISIVLDIMIQREMNKRKRFLYIERKRFLYIDQSK
ncbi:hypothetical protein LINPERHAP2_LOCUS39994 [Linum perenne]